MRKQIKPLSKAILFGACSAIALGSLGCEPEQTQASKRAAANLAAAMLARDLNEYQEADGHLQKNTSESSAAEQISLQTMAFQGESAWRKAIGVLPQVNEHEAAALAALVQIDRLTARLASENLQVAAFRGSDPTGENSPLAAAKASQAQFTQQAAELARQIEAARQQIGQLTQKITQLEAARKQAASQSAELAIQSEQTAGEAGMNLFRQSTALKQKASMLAHELSGAQTQLARLQMTVAQQDEQRKSAEAAAAAAGAQAQQIEAAWAARQAGMAERSAAAKQVLGSPGIRAQVKVFATAMAEADKARKEADDFLVAAMDRYQTAGSIGNKLFGDLTRSIQNPNMSESPLQESWRRMQLHVHPMNFQFNQARILSHRGAIYMNLRNLLQTQVRVSGALQAALQAANLPMPKELAGPNLAEEAKNAAALATQYMTEAERIFGDIAERGLDPAQKSQAAIERVFAQYALHQLGNKQSLAAAQKGLKELVAEGAGAMLPPLPPELETVVPRKAVSAAAPAAAPARTPLPAAPAVEQ